MNKSKHSQKGEYKEENGRTHIQKDKRITYKGELQKENQVLKLSPLTRSISNKERGRPP
jgi:hypothetical protein